ncbi:hypothetical protein BGW80DRAFT_283271 [Lactifluus volemus]|nr:hypothetical protein BGW80DRAFT_283271 [Lactifluus volemus]
MILAFLALFLLYILLILHDRNHSSFCKSYQARLFFICRPRFSTSTRVKRAFLLAGFPVLVLAFFTLSATDVLAPRADDLFFLRTIHRMTRGKLPGVEELNENSIVVLSLQLSKK